MNTDRASPKQEASVTIKFLNKRLFLAESKVKGFSEYLHFFVEYFVLFRWIYFKNRPRGNLLLLRALLIVGLFATAYYFIFSSFRLLLAGIDVEPMVAFIAFVTIGYWKMNSAFYEKSEQCAKLYASMLKAAGKGNIDAASLTATNLSTMLLNLDLWGHRSYSWVFVSTLEQSIEFAYSEQSDFRVKDYSRDKVIELANKNKLQVSHARELIMNYQDHLLAKIGM